MYKGNVNLAAANWSKYQTRPTWSVITSRELCEVFGVSLQTINNWKMRNILPPPLPKSSRLSGHKNFYRIADIRAWAENRSATDIHWEWALKWLPEHVGQAQTLHQVEFLVNAAYDLFGVEQPRIPLALPFDAGIPLP